jgi:L-cystine uptake protein TcyP (sodium:dicarboxylate symporter family)
MQLNESIIIPIIIAIVELFKGLGVPVKFSALIAVVVGMVIGVIYLHPGDLKYGIFDGVIYGLTAAGLYSGAKNTVQQIRNGRNDKGNGPDIKK